MIKIVVECDGFNCSSSFERKPGQGVTVSPSEWITFSMFKPRSVTPIQGDRTNHERSENLRNFCEWRCVESWAFANQEGNSGDKWENQKPRTISVPK